MTAENVALAQNSGSFDLRGAVARWSASPLDFVLEALFRITREAWQPWQPGTPRPEVPPVGPDLWQGQLLDDVAKAKATGHKRKFSVRAGHGVGKALAVSEPVLTPHGWVPIGQLAPGDLVASVDGTFTRVVGVYHQGKRPLYRVTLDDGCCVVADADHRWTTTTRSDRKHGKPGAVRTTREIMATLTFPNGSRAGLNHCLPRLRAVQHPKAVVPIDPYVLGVWLGDGSARGRVTTNALDHDIVAACGHRTVALSGGSATFSPPGLCAALRVLGLDGCTAASKFVPRVYMHGSVEQRTALLQGLLDTDGTVGRNNAVTFDTASLGLADAVAELVRSLGGVARRSGRQGRVDGADKLWSYRVYIALPPNVAPFRCSRKAGRYTPQHGHKNKDRTLQRFIASVDYIGDDDAVCIAVEHPSHLFVTRDHIVTHNTTTEAWLILWFVLFHRDLKVPVTANSQDQLRDILWAEIAKWHRQLPPFLRDLVEVSAERVFVKADPDGAFAVARTARAERPEALQGFHAGTLAFFVDEASGVPDIIFEVAGGALSSDDVWMFMFANPTRLEGYYYRSHHANRDRWNVYHVPCHAAVRVSDSYAHDIAHEYGENSNVYRVRVLGEFPLEEDDSVVALGLIEAAVARDVLPTDAAIVWGLDVARFGDDATALCKRQGNVLIEPTREWKKLDLMQVCGIVSKEYRETPADRRPSAINIDVIGLGAGVVDRLRELGLPARGVNVGESPASEDGRYMRLRDELWFLVREWFDSRAVSIPRDDALIAELVGPKYRIESSGKIKVESKDDMKKRGVRSPNRADALCLTFAGGDMKVARRFALATTNYDPFQVGTDDFERAVRQTQAGQDYSPF